VTEGVRGSKMVVEGGNGKRDGEGEWEKGKLFHERQCPWK